MLWLLSEAAASFAGRGSFLVSLLGEPGISVEASLGWPPVLAGGVGFGTAPRCKSEPSFLGAGEVEGVEDELESESEEELELSTVIGLGGGGGVWN